MATNDKIMTNAPRSITEPIIDVPMQPTCPSCRKPNEGMHTCSPQVGERARFEAWLIKRQRRNGIGARLSDSEFITTDAHGSYTAIGFNLAYEAWQAATQARVPDGWKSAPILPTREMVLALMHTIDSAPKDADDVELIVYALANAIAAAPSYKEE